MWSLYCPYKSRLLSLMCHLERAVQDISRVRVFGVGKEFWCSQKTRCDNIEAGY